MLYDVSHIQDEFFSDFSPQSLSPIKLKLELQKLGDY
jgi:hypothetical protein